ncbi:hypothetical protein [uncultured Bacteroides sp.]|uniref:TapB family protein n=1 Tax=uncultured Bacteroides sp. TaxID=162156 RepID=UPI0026148D7F|nr:hypothetical protein [uncultured Bacteroides sp.]
MKKMLFMVAFALACQAIHAQYFCSNKGTELHYVNYDDAGQSVSNETMTVSDVARNNVGVAARYFSKIVTVKSKTEYTLYDWSYDGKNTVCKEDLMYGEYIADDLDPAAYNKMAHDAMAEVVKFKGDNSIILKNDPKAGDTMPDRSYSYVGTLLRNETHISGGSYLGRETVSTTAGKFDCIKISYLKRSKIMLKSETLRVTEWYAKGVGLVKSEKHDTKGLAKGKTLLVKIVKK